MSLNLRTLRDELEAQRQEISFLQGQVAALLGAVSTSGAAIAGPSTHETVAGAGERTEEIAWLQRHGGELARRHPGEWIAIEGSKLVAHASDLPTLIGLAEQAGYAHPFITAIPSEPITSLHV